MKNLEKGDALIVVDVQRDFCTGGALAVPGGDEIVPVLNRWIQAAEQAGVPIFFSRDWHPKGHISFEGSGGPWPPHCLQDSEGAQFHPQLARPESARIITKGVRFDKDQNSAFDDTGLAAELKRLEVRRLWVGGLAEDVCVRATVLDGLEQGFDVHVIEEATRPVDIEERDRALEEMQRKGATIEGRS
jgi:nicotinamidase/pyrazinamidase